MNGPEIDSVASDGPPNAPIVSGSTLVVTGRGFGGDGVTVRLGAAVATPTTLTEHELRVPVSAFTPAVRAGVAWWSNWRGRAGRRAVAPGPASVHADHRATGESAVWRPRLDLLASDRFDQGFVVEVETDGRAHRRFGDGIHGMAPAPSTVFTATFSVGGGTVGNVGHDVLTAARPGTHRHRARHELASRRRWSRSRAGGRRAPVRPGRLLHPGARRYRGRLGFGGGASPRDPERLGAAALDGQLVDGLPYRRPGRWPTARRGAGAGRPPRRRLRPLPGRRLRPRAARPGRRAGDARGHRVPRERCVPLGRRRRPLRRVQQPRHGLWPRLLPPRQLLVRGTAVREPGRRRGDERGRHPQRGG